MTQRYAGAVVGGALTEDVRQEALEAVEAATTSCRTYLSADLSSATDVKPEAGVVGSSCRSSTVGSGGIWSPRVRILMSPTSDRRPPAPAGGRCASWRITNSTSWSNSIISPHVPPGLLSAATSSPRTAPPPSAPGGRSHWSWPVLPGVSARPRVCRYVWRRLWSLPGVGEGRKVPLPAALWLLRV